MLIVISD